MRIELFPFAHVFRKDSRIKLVIDGPGNSSQNWFWGFWHWNTVPGGFDVSIQHSAAHESRVVLPVRADAQFSPDFPTAPSGIPTCDVLVVFVQPCRASPSIQSFTSSVTDNNLVTLTYATTGGWYVAGISGPRLLDAGGVGDVGLVAATGSTQFRAPPGQQRYTLDVPNSIGVSVTRTIVVDVPGFTGPDPRVLPSQPTSPYVVNWTSPGTTWWASIDGFGLNGITPLSTPQVSIPPARLGPGSHVVKLSTCYASGCSNHWKLTTLFPGTVTQVAPAFTAVSGVADASSLVVTIQPDGGGAPLRFYSPYAGVVWTTPSVGTHVAANAVVATVVIADSTQEQLQINVN